MTELHCWYYFDDGNHTCMLPHEHDGSHKPTPDRDIIISYATGEVVDLPEDD